MRPQWIQSTGRGRLAGQGNRERVGASVVTNPMLVDGKAPTARISTGRCVVGGTVQLRPSDFDRL
eukprot:COSAG01_NODE_87_length_27454_cov_201.243575_12_plen_65_part_00